MITCSFVIPTPLQEILPPEAIWNHDIKFVTGQTYQIIAPSGRGKSTLIGLLAGLRGDYSGQIHINNRNIQQFTTQDWANWRATGASFVFQDLRLFPNLTALQNIQLAQNISQPIATIHGIEQWADQLQIKHKLMQLCGELSFGQQQRIAILRALAKPFQWLMLDEPFSHLDPNNTQLAWQLILEIAQQRKAGVIITSLNPYANILCDHTLSV
jgi:putative ABC transport system ATP-binding protein